jgi:hypothetical protein
MVAGVGVLRIALALGFWALAVMVSQNPPLEVLAFRLKAIDSLGYNRQALHILAYWNGTRDLYLETLTFSLVVAVLYKIFWAHPLVISAFNSICYACVGLFAYSIVRELGRSRWETRTLALAVCLWPASLVWSTAPLKEGPILLTIFGFLYCFLMILSDRPLGRIKWFGLGLGLLISLFCMVFLRFYLWYLLWGMFPALILHQILPPGRERSRPGWGRVCMGGLLLMAGLVLSQPFSQENIIHVNPGGKIKTSQTSADQIFAFNLITEANAADKKVAPASQPSSSASYATPSFLQRLAKKLSDIRRTSARLGGSSLSPEVLRREDALDISKDFQTWPGAFRATGSLLESGLRNLLLFPNPWEPWPKDRGWGPTQLAVSALSLFWYLIMPGLAVGVIMSFRRRPAVTTTLCLWGLTLGIVLGITTLNRGTLFRLRDMVLMPLILLWHPWPYLKLWRLLHKGNGSRPG